MMEKDLEGNTPVGNQSRRNSGSSNVSVKEIVGANSQHQPSFNGLDESEKSVLTSEDINATAAAGPVPMDPVTPTLSPSPIPNGGLYAWVQVLGCAFLFFNTWYIVPWTGQIMFPPNRYAGD